MREGILVIGLTCLYWVISTLLLLKVNLTSKTVIDELFHIPQGLAYCNYDFLKWDPKITTLPGLYYISTLLCAPIGRCDISCLRFTNVLAGSINLGLFILIRRVLRPKEDVFKSSLIAINIALLPPLYFFNHVYYTDVLSITAVMSMLYFGLIGRYFWASLFGFFSFMVRQTNIIYVVFILGIRVVGILYNSLFRRRRFLENNIKVSKQEAIYLGTEVSRNPHVLTRLTKVAPRLPIEVGCYLSVLLTFVIFVVLNGSIVVGDKQAHTASLHIPQLFYYCLFTLFFSWPHFIVYIKEFVKFCITYCYVSIPLVLLIMLLVHFNTITHPYLLADNRHYIFYVWRYFFNSDGIRLAWSPIYLFACYIVFRWAYSTTDVRFFISYLPTTILVLCFQGLIELRYFFIPYILLKLFGKQTSFFALAIELVFHTVINVLTLNVFFNKEIFWVDFPDPQRLIW